MPVLRSFFYPQSFSLDNCLTILPCEFYIAALGKIVMMLGLQSKIRSFLFSYRSSNAEE